MYLDWEFCFILFLSFTNSASYDMSVVVWDVSLEDPIVATRNHHSEFVVGVEWGLFNDQLVSCGWDSKVAFWPQVRTNRRSRGKN